MNIYLNMSTFVAKLLTKYYNLFLSKLNFIDKHMLSKHVLP